MCTGRRHAPSRKTPPFGRAAVALAGIALLHAGAVSAWNRNDILAELDRVPSDWSSNPVAVHLAGDPVDPGVRIGSAVTLVIEAERPAHFTLVLVDARGELSVIAPEALTARAGQATRRSVFPPEGTGELLQDRPAGVQTVYAFATERAVPGSALGLEAGSDMATFGREEARVIALRELLSDSAVTGRRSVDRYRYRVDGDVGLGTRAARRELELRVQQVDVLESAPPGSADRTAGERIASAPLAVNDIRFETDSAELTATGRVQLDVIGSELLRQGETRGVPMISLAGHTDDTGEESYNEALSRRRAEAARRYLVETFGLEAARIETVGHGESRPLVPNEDAASRARNRRVEIRVLGG